MTVFGTRPDTIKMAPVVHALNADPRIDSIVCVTAQHRQMLDDLLELFEIVPDYALDIMTADQSLTEITTRVLIGMEPRLVAARPDVVLVLGDTGTSTAAALAACYQHVPVGHVEAGALMAYTILTDMGMGADEIATVIGAIGVLNDVTVTQASTVFELASLGDGSSRRVIFLGAMRVGRDHIASTVYTLVLAYAGSALPLLVIWICCCAGCVVLPN